MKSTTLLPAICLALSTACASANAPLAPATQDIDFIRGCWIERVGNQGRHIRFLPGRDNRAIYTAYIPDFADYPTPPDSIVVLEVATNGASLTRTILDADQTPIETATLDPALLPASAPQTGRTAAWRFPGERRWYIAHTANDRTLRLFILNTVGNQPLETEDFSGPRDGCD